MIGWLAVRAKALARKSRGRDSGRGNRDGDGDKGFRRVGRGERTTKAEDDRVAVKGGERV